MSMYMPTELPKYPASRGPNTALQLQNRLDGYTSAAADLRRELQAAEDRMIDALAEHDRRTAGRNRLREIARPKTTPPIG